MNWYYVRLYKKRTWHTIALYNHISPRYGETHTSLCGITATVGWPYTYVERNTPHWASIWSSPGRHCEKCRHLQSIHKGELP